MLDKWYKTVIEDAVWYTDSARSAGGNSVYIGSYITVLIPFHDEFKPYAEWKNLPDREKYFTMQANDFIILGEMDETIDSSNITEVLQRYGEEVCNVKHHNENYDRFGATVQIKVQGV